MINRLMPINGRSKIRDITNAHKYPKKLQLAIKFIPLVSSHVSIFVLILYMYKNTSCPSKFIFRIHFSLIEVNIFEINIPLGL